MKTSKLYGIDFKIKYNYPIVKFPKDWKELEKIVAHILNYSNCKTELNKNMTLVRGISEIDVYAEVQDKYKSICICECKYWNKSVKQEVVDSFRTRMNDIGANLGIIISKKGFQAGCYEKIKYTNIKLFDFCEFIDFYKEEYLLNRAKELSKLVIPLMDYSDFTKDFYDEDLKNKNEVVQEKIKKLMSINNIFSSTVFSLGYYWNSGHLYFDNLIDFYKEEGIEFDNYCELCDYTIEKINNNLYNIDCLFEKEIRMESSKGDYIDKVGI